MSPLRIAFLHPDLGIGGAERLVVDAALGLQNLGHHIDLYTSHHDPTHCFEETRDGTLRVHHVVPPFPRSIRGKFHILFAHARQLHLTLHLLLRGGPSYDVYFVDQLSTCIPFLRTFGKTRVVFYCHFPDKLLANGEFVEGKFAKMKGGILKRLYRIPMDWVEELTTRQADIILANSKFTSQVFQTYFRSIPRVPRVVYPGINISAYETAVDWSDPDIVQVISDRPTLLSLNRFEKKKNVALALAAFAQMKTGSTRLVIGGGYDHRLEDNIQTLAALVRTAELHSLTFNIITPASSNTPIPPFKCQLVEPDILFVLNFTTGQRSALLTSSSTLCLLYTPANEHFGIVPVEGMLCGLPVLACDSGGPTESILDSPESERTGWLCRPDAAVWADVLSKIVALSKGEREALSERAKSRAKTLFGMQTMARDIEDALQEASTLGPVEGMAILVLI
ncbi:Alpha-1,3-mannosyltransferase-like protein [Pleurotus ostreatus]|uniref:Alpha-1,3/1,6-mannosyltransferase ALG2 n=1 Tax=Pleurotus ostreatus TaxID=5322 RepID=A0A8H7DXM3_PLEOS|nr:Alpha-1,3-mannosyltransferase-like protein [Pleurotus ostreatus]KAF7441232.1 Alpha-1,3-mannosyltransferase-like protein [Pleurotus ostreatus]